MRALIYYVVPTGQALTAATPTGGCTVSLVSMERASEDESDNQLDSILEDGHGGSPADTEPKV